MEILGTKELMEQVRDKGLCVSCGACVEICPYHKSYKGKIALVFDCDMTPCQCYAYCPQTETDRDLLSRTMFGTMDKGEALGQYRSIIAAKAGSKIKSNRFQNGGTVSALFTHALDSGLIDAAVLTGQNDDLPEPMLIENACDVASCATTKYMATPTLAAVHKAIRDGRKNLGVAGTACQVKALATIKANPLGKAEQENSIGLSLGLFCTWSLDTRKFSAFLAGETGGEKIVSMDVPPPPAETFKIKTENEEREFPLKEIRKMIPRGCACCPDMTAEWADVSVGAYEGKPGWNTLIIRSEKGEQWVEEAIADDYLVRDEFPRSRLEHLTLGADNKRKKAEEFLTKEKK